MREHTTRRTLLRAAGTAAAGATLLTTGAAATHSDEAVVSRAPTEAVDGQPYPTMGTDEDNPTMTIYGNPKCPYTRDFVLNHLADVVEEYVRPGELNVCFRALVYEPDPDEAAHGSAYYYISDSDPDIARADYGVWNWEPENYWGYLYEQFQDLPSGTVTAPEMAERMKEGGVRNWGKIRNEVYDDEYQSYLDETRADAADLDVDWTPTATMDGERTAPHHSSEALFEWIEDNL